MGTLKISGVMDMLDSIDDFEYLDDFDDEVWDEKRWEEFMQEADRKAAEYLKRLEEERQKKDSVPHLPEPKGDSYFDDEIAEESDPEFSDLKPEAWESPRMYWEDGDFEQIPAYQIAYDFAIAVHNFVELFYPEGTEVPEIKLTPELSRIHTSAVKTRETVKEWIEELRSKIWWR
jgi:hypothetical protein